MSKPFKNKPVNFYDASTEQNGICYLDGQTDLEIVKKIIRTLKSLKLSREEWRWAYQIILMKASQTEPLQANHQFTPDAIGFQAIFLLLIDQLMVASDTLHMSGTGARRDNPE